MRTLILGFSFAALCAAQSVVTLETSCPTVGQFTSFPTVTNQPISGRLNVGQRGLQSFNFRPPQGYTAQTSPQPTWSLTNVSALPNASERTLLSTTGPSTTLAVNYQAAGRASLRISVTYYAYYGTPGEVPYTCNGSIEVIIDVVASPVSVNQIAPRLFTLCGPDVDVVISGTGFANNVQVEYGNASRTTSLNLRELSSTRLVATLPRSVVSSYYTTSTSQALQPRFVISNGNVGGTNPFTEYTDFQVRPTPIISGITPAPADGAVILTVTGSNFAADTALYLESPGGVRKERATVQGTINATSFRASLPEATYAALGAYTARVVNLEGNPSGSYYEPQCSSPFQAPNLSAPSNLILRPSTATACAVGFNMTVTGTNILNSPFAPRFLVGGNTVTTPSPVSGVYTIPITSAQLVTTASNLTVAVANQTAANQFTANATASLVLSPAPSLANPNPAQIAPNTATSISLTVQNRTPQTRIVLRRTNQPDLTLSMSPATGSAVTVNVPASAAGSIELVALNADEANPNGGLPSTGAGCPTRLAVPVQAGALISQLMPPQEFVGRTNNLTLSIRGSNFRQGARVFVGSDPAVTGTFINAGEVQVVLQPNRFTTTGSIPIRVQNTDDPAPSAVTNLAVVAPRVPTINVSATPTSPASPTEQPRLTITQSNNSERPLIGVITLSFQPDAATGVTSWPATGAPSFPTGATARTMTVTIPTTGTTVPLPGNNTLGAFRLPVVAGIVTARLTSLTVEGTQVSLPPPAGAVATVTVRAVAPEVVSSVPPLFSRPGGSADFIIDFDAISTLLNLTAINLRFNTAAGTNVEGPTTFALDRSNNAALFDRLNAFFRENLATGGQFRLQIPLSITSGDANAIQSVVVRLSNSAGDSAERTINRQ
jgi:hypothetical protein